MQYEKLQKNMQDKSLEPYRLAVEKAKIALFFKRFFDIVVSLALLIILSPVMILTAVAVKIDSKGPVIFKQDRVGKNCKIFKMYKFRTMIVNAESVGAQVTSGSGDSRVTKVGRFLRKTRLDEFMQFFNVLKGDMSIIGPRPEVARYVAEYKPVYYATLLVRPGISSNVSIDFCDEGEILKDKDDPEQYYIDVLMPQKMELNLKYIENISLLQDIKIFFRTIKNAL